VKPRLERAFRFPLFRPRPNPQKDLLHQVLGRRLVADDAQDLPPYACAVVGEKRVERLLVALLHGLADGLSIEFCHQGPLP
jgi:hypothetical protein